MEKPKRIVINSCYGGFSLSHEAIMMYSEMAKLNLGFVEDKKYEGLGLIHYYLDGEVDDVHYWSDRRISRDDPDLVNVVAALGEAANGRCADLKIVEIPKGVDWEICEYDGKEWVAEVHRTWY